MSKVLLTESHLSDIADAIRGKNGQTARYTPGQMAAAIQAIPTGGAPVLDQLSVTQNGTYMPGAGVDGFDEVVVNVSGGSGVYEGMTIPDVNDYTEGDVYLLYVEYDVSFDRPSGVVAPTAASAGQNGNSALTAFNYSGILNNVASWTTNDWNFNDLWIYADYQSPVIMKSFTVAPRTWAGNRQIYTAIIEGSNDASTWTYIATGPMVGNEMPENRWTTFGIGNATAYRYYRLRTETSSDGRVNGSATFTLQGVGFLETDVSGSRTYLRAYYKQNGAWVIIG